MSDSRRDKNRDIKTKLSSNLNLCREKVNDGIHRACFDVMFLKDMASGLCFLDYIHLQCYFASLT